LLKIGNCIAGEGTGKRGDRKESEQEGE